MVNRAKYFPKILSILFITWPSFMTRSFVTQKIDSKIYLALCTITDYDITTFKVD